MNERFLPPAQAPGDRACASVGDHQPSWADLYPDQTPALYGGPDMPAPPIFDGRPPFLPDPNRFFDGHGIALPGIAILDGVTFRRKTQYSLTGVFEPADLFIMIDLRHVYSVRTDGTRVVMSENFARWGACNYGRGLWVLRTRRLGQRPWNFEPRDWAGRGMPPLVD